MAWSERAGAEPRSLVPEIAVLEDPEGRLTVDEVASPPLEARFRASASDRPNLGYTRSAYWLRVRYQLPDERRWLPRRSR